MADLRTLAKRIAASKTDEGLVSELWSHMRPEEGKLLAEELSGVLLDERIDQMERQAGGKSLTFSTDSIKRRRPRSSSCKRPSTRSSGGALNNVNRAGPGR